MKWKNVKLIFKRELRDQLRDRRTLFTVAIMPMILYPLMGIAMLQVAQFMREYPTKVWVVGADNLPKSPSFFEDGKINPDFVSAEEGRLIELQLSDGEDSEFQTIIKQLREQTELTRGQALVDQLIQKEMQERGFDVAVIVPSAVAVPKDSRRTKTLENPDADSAIPSAEVPAQVEAENSDAQHPNIYVFQNSANDKSRMGAERFNGALNKWKISLVKKTLAEHDVPLSLVRGVIIANADVANKDNKKAAAWSKILPFIIMIWSLTGAFYPAIDLCAGEKERGTFETLLSSPAARSEIAIGKLLTVITFSMATSILNLVSMGFTGLFVASRLGSGMGAGLPMGAPPLACIGWLLLALIPISALFSAVALAAAAFARSSKEGQYYLVPLMMISMPLMMVPMLPAAQLDFGTSLIPVSGLMLMLRGLIEGQHAECAKFAGPVCAVTLICCWLSVRWVVSQFNSETVLFRASERFGVGAWLRQVMQERNDLPSFGSAILCGVDCVGDADLSARWRSGSTGKCCFKYPFERTRDVGRDSRIRSCSSGDRRDCVPRLYSVGTSITAKQVASDLVVSNSVWHRSWRYSTDNDYFCSRHGFGRDCHPNQKHHSLYSFPSDSQQFGRVAFISRGICC